MRVVVKIEYPIRECTDFCTPLSLIGGCLAGPVYKPFVRDSVVGLRRVEILLGLTSDFSQQSVVFGGV